MTAPAEELPTSWTVYRLPRSHWHAHLHNFAWDRVTPKSLPTRIATFVQAVADGNAPHLILTGEPGIGKSHLGVGVYRALTAILGTAVVSWHNVPAFFEAVKRSYDSDYDPWTEFEDARRLVVLDDFFGREFTPHEKDLLVPRLLGVASENNAALLITMNPDVQELPQRLHRHEISRLLADATIIPMTAEKDWRRG